MKKVIQSFVIMLLITLPHSAAMGESSLSEVTFEVTKIYNKYDPYLPRYTLLGKAPIQDKDAGLDTTQEFWDYKVVLGVRYDLIRFNSFRMYWDQRIAGYSTQRQYRKVHWDFELGTQLWKHLDMFWHHKSEHGLETAADNRYPLEDVYGVRVYLYKGNNK